VIEDGLGDEILSGDEIRELLRDELRPEPATEAAAGDELQSVLVVSRREDEVALLRERLELHGASVTVVRNPFTALDQLRTAHYRAILTDLELWASGGLLLFERWRPLPSRPLLVFVADRGQEPPETIAGRLRRSGAAAVLFRPLRARDVEEAALAVLGPSEEPPSGEEEPPRAAPAIEDGASVEELGWLRLFFHASRALRTTRGTERRIRALVSLIEEHLGPALVAVGWSERGRSRVIASTTRSADAQSMLQSLRSVEESSGGQALVVHSAGGSKAPEGAVSLVMAGLSGARQFREDLRHLLAQATGEAGASGPESE
jgi:CheY-like chemotaxis protein